MRLVTRRPGEQPLRDFRGTTIPLFALLGLLTLCELIYPPRGDWEARRALVSWPLPFTMVVIAIGLVLEGLRWPVWGTWRVRRLFGIGGPWGLVLAGAILLAYLWAYFHIELAYVRALTGP